MQNDQVLFVAGGRLDIQMHIRVVGKGKSHLEEVNNEKVMH
jgi:hypothetical protein